MVTDIKKLMDRITKQQKEEGQRELQVLQSQINPHFLYNTLDTLQWKALEYDAVELSDLIISLSSFFRISLSKGKEFISLEKELEHVNNYLKIQQFRYSDILDYSINCDARLYSYQLPKIIIQPLVENAIYHGIKPKLNHGNITINVFDELDYLKIVVEDDGVGIPDERLIKIRKNLEEHISGNNYGLYNVNRRIYLLFGEGCGLTINSNENQGTIITMKLLKVMEE
jgi:two-component system sensor histidine kinase YesM